MECDVEDESMDEMEKRKKSKAAVANFMDKSRPKIIIKRVYFVRVEC